MAKSDDVSLALVTPSFGPDFEQCANLVASARVALRGQVTHHLIVPSEDVDLFATLGSECTQLHVQEDLLPSWITPIDVHERRWTSARSGDFTGWVLQQIVKLSVFDAVDADAVVFLDSDNYFVRPVDLRRTFLRDGMLSLRRGPAVPSDQRIWLDQAASALGLQPANVADANYVTASFVSWWRTTTLALHDRLESQSDTDWQEALLAHHVRSEYALYGVFVENVIGLEEARHFLDDRRHAIESWGVTLETTEDVRTFLERRKAHHLTVMVHSHDKVPTSLYAPQCRAILERNMDRAMFWRVYDRLYLAAIELVERFPRLRRVARVTPVTVRTKRLARRVGALVGRRGDGGAASRGP